MSRRILILCTGNSARSQMAEGILRALDPTLEVHSAGTEPAVQVNPLAVAVMQEVGIDISMHRPKHVEQFVSQPFDHVITVCDHANERCPVFIGAVRHRVHLGFEDPAAVVGTDEERLSAFRRIRDEIRTVFGQFHRTNLAGEG